MKRRRKRSSIPRAIASDKDAVIRRITLMAKRNRRCFEVWLWSRVIQQMVIDAIAYHETTYSQGDLALERELAYQMIDRLHPCYIGMCDAAGFSPTEIRGMVMKARAV